MEKNENGYSWCRNGNSDVSDMNDNSASMPVQLAMVYSPVQQFRGLYEPSDALAHGTLFEELYKPLERGGRCRYEKR